MCPSTLAYNNIVLESSLILLHEFHEDETGEGRFSLDYWHLHMSGIG